MADVRVTDAMRAAGLEAEREYRALREGGPVDLSGYVEAIIAAALSTESREPVGRLYTNRCGYCGAPEGTVDPNEGCDGTVTNDPYTGEPYVGGPHQFGKFEPYLGPTESREPVAVTSRVSADNLPWPTVATTMYGKRSGPWREWEAGVKRWVPLFLGPTESQE